MPHLWDTLTTTRKSERRRAGEKGQKAPVAGKGCNWDSIFSETLSSLSSDAKNSAVLLGQGHSENNVCDSSRLALPSSIAFRDAKDTWILGCDSSHRSYYRTTMIAVKDGGPSERIHEVKNIVCAFISYSHSKSASQLRFDSLLFCLFAMMLAIS